MKAIDPKEQETQNDNNGGEQAIEAVETATENQVGAGALVD